MSDANQPQINLTPFAPPEGPFKLNFTRAELSSAVRAEGMLETMAKALNREVMTKFTDWIRDEMAKRYQDDHPGKPIPDDDGLLKWAIGEGYHGKVVHFPTDPHDIRRFVLFKGSEAIEGLLLKINSFNVTAAEAESIRPEK
jgi:hypothetical protein